MSCLVDSILAVNSLEKPLESNQAVYC